MIYSGVDDNWLRVELLFSMVTAFHEITQGNDCSVKVSDDGKVKIDFRLFDDIEKESCAVGMVMVWSVVTLEALVNHALAETIINQELVKKVIEDPFSYLQDQKIKCSTKSELSKKIVALVGDQTELDELLRITDHLCHCRNNLIHDKPIDYSDWGEGEVDPIHLGKRGELSKGPLRYKDLKPLFKNCDLIREFVLGRFNSDHLKISHSTFYSLTRV